MGANLLILASTVLLPPSQSDTTTNTEQPANGIAFERPSDLLQYNRVQGLSFGLGYRARLPATRSTGLYATARYGLSDERVTGRLTMVHESRRGRFALSGYYDVADVDPVSPGRTLGNSANGLFAGHDNADYLLARGGAANFQILVGAGLELLVAARVERQNSISRVAKSAVNDFLGGTGLFPPNPPVRDGTFGGASVRLSGLRRTSWNLTLDVLNGAGQAPARLFGDLRRSLGAQRLLTWRLKAGAGTRPALPQTLFRLGGLHTVRGFEYGRLRGQAFWAAQLDVAPFDWRIRPIMFLDAGQAGDLSELISSTALIGGGAGLSLLNGLVRFDLSRPISPEGDRTLRFDLVIQGLR